MTHVLLIQISRTSSIIDIVVPSKMAAGGHFVKKSCVLTWQTNSASIWNGQNCYRKWISDIQNGRSIWNGHRSEVAYRSEMTRNAIEGEFRISKMGADGSHFVKKKLKLHNIIDLKWPEMRSKVNFGHSKWARWPFCKNSFEKKFRIDLKWPEMPSKVMAADSHFVQNLLPKWLPAAI